jgi:hypothetical protein
MWIVTRDFALSIVTPLTLAGHQITHLPAAARFASIAHADEIANFRERRALRS